MKNKIIEILRELGVKAEAAKHHKISSNLWDETLERTATRIMEQLGGCYVECGKDETTFALYSLETRGLRKYLKKLPPHPKEETDWKDSDEFFNKTYRHLIKDKYDLSIHQFSAVDMMNFAEVFASKSKEEPKDSGWISVDDIGPFAKWREDNRWFSFEDGKWKYTFEHGTAISNKSYEKNYTKTTAELFQMYRDSIIAAGLPPTVETKKD